MKHTLGILAFLFFTSSLFARGSACGAGAHGFYVQPVAKSSQIGIQAGYWLGLQAGVMLSEHVGIGAAFNSLESPYYRGHRLDQAGRDDGTQLAVAYAGVVLSYSGQIGNGWHSGVSLLVGDGWMGWEHSRPDYWGNWDTPHRTRFLAIEPTFHLEGDIHSRLRVTGGLGYFRAQGQPDWISGVMYSVGLKYLTW